MRTVHLTLAACVVLAGCSNGETSVTPIAKKAAPRSPSEAPVGSRPQGGQRNVEPPKVAPPVVKEEVNPLVGTWRLVESSEAAGETASGIPDYVLWETVEFTEDGEEVTRYKHARGNDEVFESRIKYSYANGKLTKVAQLATSEYSVKFRGNKLEIRSGASYSVYERE